ncbi:hypothetical protein BJ878DRAFT_52280 [Calycina marina]|uniref:Uncharacterized protein n=1 Tax=Calycina marina TaxID=1763456 RepID=A0A9P7Z4J6_9HELO|nr:hypothetical protein BJ878DRAFT_52280 [Calycina marina]
MKLLDILHSSAVLYFRALSLHGIVVTSGIQPYLWYSETVGRHETKLSLGTSTFSNEVENSSSIDYLQVVFYNGASSSCSHCQLLLHAVYSPHISDITNFKKAPDQPPTHCLSSPPINIEDVSSTDRSSELQMMNFFLRGVECPGGSYKCCVECCLCSCHSCCMSRRAYRCLTEDDNGPKEGSGEEVYIIPDEPRLRCMNGYSNQGLPVPMILVTVVHGEDLSLSLSLLQKRTITGT